MALLTTRGESSEFRYTPFEATGTSAATWLGLLAASGLAVLFVDHGLLRVVFWSVVVAGPVQLAHLGFSYSLSANEMVVWRFGSVRAQLPLAEFVRTGGFLGWAHADFRGRRVVLPFSFRGEAQQFLTELTVNAARAGNAVAHVGPSELPSGEVRVPLAALAFAPNCVVCGELASRSVLLEAWRRVLTLREGPVVQLPVCASHGHRRAATRWAVALGVVALGGGVPLALAAAFTALPSLVGGAVLSLTLGAFVLRVALFFGLDAWSDWLSLGVLARGLSADRLDLTLRLRSQALRDELLASTRAHTQRWLTEARSGRDAPPSRVDV